MFNPDLLQPGEQPGQQRVQPLTQFRNKVGDVYIESEKNWSTVRLPEDHYYFSSMKMMNMFRPDGTKISFIEHLFKTNIEGTVRYLEDEIENGHSYIRRATAKEVEAFGIRIDPIGTITAGLRATLEVELRQSIEAELRAKYNIAEPGAVAVATVGDTVVAKNDTAGLADELSHDDKLAALLSIPEAERTDIQKMLIKSLQTIVARQDAGNSFQAGITSSAQVADLAPQSGR